MNLNNMNMDLQPLQEMQNQIANIGNIGNLGSDRALGGILHTDLVESPASYSLNVDLPGIRPEDLSIEITDNTLTISGNTTRHYERSQGDVFHSVERHHGSAQRVIALPPGIDTETAETELRDGVLTVTLPKINANVLRPVSRRLEIQTGNPRMRINRGEEEKDETRHSQPTQPSDQSQTSKHKHSVPIQTTKNPKKTSSQRSNN
jgi:HSP20 family protein